MQPNDLQAAPAEPSSRQQRNRQRFAIGCTAAAALLLTYAGVHWIGEYGFGLFIFTPLFIGAAPVIAIGIKYPIRAQQAVWLGLSTLGIFTTGLLLMAMEGLICIAMAAPFGVVLAITGSMIGYVLVQKRPGGAPAMVMILAISIPLVSLVERNVVPKAHAVVTSVEIDAPPEVVWRNVVSFPQLEAPKAIIFKIGIAYPVYATIHGGGVGAVRHCQFNTGAFVEPITVWDEPRLLGFDVLEQPLPMKEVSFRAVDAPHLHGYFVSQKGQFKLTPTTKGRTLLEGTTWYYHKIKPAAYWQLWSDYIIHQIHLRVLEHIKRNAEGEN